MLGELIVPYIPIYIHEALKFFVNNAEINVKSGRYDVNLADLFPLLKQGYCLSPSILNFMSLYIRINNLSDPNRNQFVIPDELFNVAFNGDISAFYYSYRDENDRMSEIIMEDAINEGLIEESLNTGQVIQLIHKHVNPFHFNSFYLRDIISLNSSVYSEITGYDSLLDDPIFNQSLKDEYQISEALNNIFIILRDVEQQLMNEQRQQDILMSKFEKQNINTIVSEIINFEPDNIGYKLLLNRLFDYNFINPLHYAIIIKDSVLVSKYLQRYDPRDNRNEALSLAYKVGNQEIINTIKKNIYERNFYERETLEMMTLELGHGTVSDDLYNYLRRTMSY